MTKTKVLYNDTCPICSREIRHYDDLVAKGDLPLRFEPLSQAASEWNLSPDAAARQIHAKRGDEVLTGLAAFIAIWSEIPRYRWLARLASLPVVRPLANFGYNRLAAPLLFAMHQRKQRRAARDVRS